MIQRKKAVTEPEEQEKNVHKGHRARMRQRLLHAGPGCFEDHELLEMLLYYCVVQKNTNVDAHVILNEYGSLSALFQAEAQDLMRRCNFTEHTASFFLIASELMKRCSRERFKEKTVVNSLELAGDMAMSLLSYEPLECFYVINLDSQKKLLNASLIKKGKPNHIIIDVREVVENVLQHQSVSVIFAHNHPGGSLLYSHDDLMTTKKLVNVLDDIGVEVVDHIIVANDSYYSMAEHQLLGSMLTKNYLESASLQDS